MPSTLSPSAPASNTREMSLPELSPQGCGVICRIEAPDDAIAGLMAMGVCVGRRVELVKTGDPLILRVLGTRIGVSARLARRVTVVCCVTHTGACTAPGSHYPGQPVSSVHTDKQTDESQKAG